LIKALETSLLDRKTKKSRDFCGFLESVARWNYLIVKSKTYLPHEKQKVDSTNTSASFFRLCSAVFCSARYDYVEVYCEEFRVKTAKLDSETVER
jgi:hypothetical protein